MLVGYSDSEGSDDETAQPTPKQTAKPVAKTAPTLVNPSTNRVKVNLSSLTSGNGADVEESTRPAKRQRTGGGLNIDAFLPPPKQPAKALNNEGSFAAKKAQGKGLGKGVSLKTGAEPAFTRSEVSSNLDIDGEPRDIKDVIAELRRTRAPAAVGDTRAEQASPALEKEVKLVGNAMRFKPKSVARGPVKKRPVVPTAAPPQAAIPRAAASPVAAQAASVSRATTKGATTKTKVSLFSINSETTRAPATTEDHNMDDDIDMADQQFEEMSTYEDIPPQAVGAPAIAHDQSATVDGLNLSQAEMRQLFGRKAGKGGQMPDLDSIKMVKVSADDQYAANEEFRAKGEAVQHNPVRGIAPGKHSLKQLVNAAATQADALEEHFAQGKRNAKEAGSRYGW